MHIPTIAGVGLAGAVLVFLAIFKKMIRARAITKAELFKHPYDRVERLILGAGALLIVCAFAITAFTSIGRH
jgi:hypothetical protein